LSDIAKYIFDVVGLTTIFGHGGKKRLPCRFVSASRETLAYHFGKTSDVWNQR